MSSVRAKNKQLHELTDMYESLRGQVTHRSHDMQQLRSKITDSRNKLDNLNQSLSAVQLGTDLEMKTTSLDQLKVICNSCTFLVLYGQSMLTCVLADSKWYADILPKIMLPPSALGIWS